MNFFPFLSFVGEDLDGPSCGRRCADGSSLQGMVTGLSIIPEDVVSTLVDAVMDIDGVDDILPSYTSSRLGYSLIEATKHLTYGSDAEAGEPQPHDLLVITHSQSDDNGSHCPSVRVRLCVSIIATAVAKNVGHSIEKQLFTLWSKEKKTCNLPELDGVDVEILAIGW
ncbi:MAG: hypothetical protein Q4P66_07240 [Actinomycetaceae bacterium]|nr:hypothetical protein [Actinomycetaceae bacterium]